MIFDCSSRGDSQSHAEYARRMFDWRLTAMDAERQVDVERFFDAETSDYLHLFDYHGRRVTRRDLEWDDWRNWQAELNVRLRAAIAFLYGNFLRGVRRLSWTALSRPIDRVSPFNSTCLNTCITKSCVKTPEWVARDLFREAYRRHAEQAAAHLL